MVQKYYLVLILSCSLLIKSVYEGTQSTYNVSAHGLIPGTKYEPYPIPHGALQVDGTALEFNINPSSSYEEFNTNIDEVLKTMMAMLPKDL